MTDSLPDPPVAPEVDLRGYEFMPLYGHRLFGSDFNARVSDAAWRAAVTLWWKSWIQVPATSLPDDDVALCRLADLGRDLKAFRKIKDDALHGFYKCNDGRLYHRALAEWALEAWDRRVKERSRKAAWRASRERDKPGTRTGTERGHGAGQVRDVPAEGKGSDSEVKGQELQKPNPDAVASVAPAKPPTVRAKPQETRIAPDFGISNRVREWAAEKGHDRLEQRLEHFVGYCRANGKKYADWDEAFMNAVRGDWAKLPSDRAPLPLQPRRLAL